MKKIIPIILLVIALGLFVYFGRGVIGRVANIGGSAELSVESNVAGVTVLLDDQEVGETPYNDSNVKAGERKVTLKSERNSYEVTLNFLPNTEVVINRDLGTSPTFSSGQNFWIEEKGDAVLNLISDPEGATVYIDNTEVGKTPYSNSELTEGEYDVRIERPGYEPQSARVQVFDDHTLNVSFTLFPLPVPSRISPVEGSTSLYDLSSAEPVVTSDTSQWAKAVVYWNETRGLNLAGLGINREPVFDYFLDYKGNIFNAEGNMVGDPSTLELENDVLGGYLGRIQDGGSLSPEANDALSLLNVVSTRQGTILETGLGWLRVRNSPSLDGTEVAKVTVGESFPVLEEQPEWVKIQVDDTTEGWVSAEYIEITGGESSATTQETSQADEAAAGTAEDTEAQDETLETTDTSPSQETTLPDTQ